MQVYGLTIEKLKLLTDAEFAELEFPRTDLLKRVTENGVNSNRNIVQPLQIRPLSLLFFGEKSIL